MSIELLRTPTGYCAWLPKTGETFWAKERLDAFYKAVRYIIAKHKVNE